MLLALNDGNTTDDSGIDSICCDSTVSPSGRTERLTEGEGQRDWQRNRDISIGGGDWTARLLGGQDREIGGGDRTEGLVGGQDKGIC